MSRGPMDPTRAARRDSLSRQILRTTVLTATFLLVLAALSVSTALVVYTAWIHDLSRGVFALFFAVLSTQMVLNWFIWKDDEES